jgi:hypothetical protein
LPENLAAWAAPRDATIGITFERNDGHGDDPSCGKPQNVVLPLAINQRQPPATIVDRDNDMIRIIERCSAALK